jgi:hypothetical protein
MRKLQFDPGQKFSWLTVIGPAGSSPQGKALWTCRCKCGSLVDVLAHSIKTGNTKSCGCMRRPHGRSATPEFVVWSGMLSRCTNENDPAWSRYGGRGITVCAKWLDFASFYSDMGPRPPGFQLDRIDNNLGYYKENCRWATRSENARNKRNSRLVSYEGKQVTLMEASERSGISFDTLWRRLQRGDTDRLFRPVGTYPLRKKRYDAKATDRQCAGCPHISDGKE